MTTFYSPSVGGFFHSSVHGENVPYDSIEISTETHRALIDGQANGKRIVADADGRPILTDAPEPTLEELAARKRRSIDAARGAAFAAGLPYTMPDGTTDMVQTRPQDQINLLGLSSKAQRLIADGVTDPVMPFRGQSNVTRMLTPEQMDAMTLAALSHIEGIYQHSWDRKDAIDAALEAEDREGIEAVVW